MKRLLLILSTILSVTPLFAQNALENDEIIATVGVNVPMHKNIESDAIVGIHYGHCYPNGTGFRAGFQYSPSVADIDNHFGVPLSFTYRTRSRSVSERMTSGAYGALNSAGYGNEDTFRNAFTGFLANIFDRIEFSAGLTPGYISGASREENPSYHSGPGYRNKTWTEKPYSFSLSADAGININFRIWRLDLKLMPAFHYNLTNNYRYHIEKRDSDGNIISHTVRPVRWFFSFCGGLAFRF